VLESQQELQKSLHRLGGEVQKVFQRLPRTEITKRTSKIPVLRRRCQRLGSKVKEIQVSSHAARFKALSPPRSHPQSLLLSFFLSLSQDRLARISVIAEGLPAQQAGTS